MKQKKRGLGKGLSDIGLNELLSDMAAKAVATGDVAAPEAELKAEPPKPRQEMPAPAAEQIQMLPIDLINKGRYQPRRAFPEEALQELADSIRSQGIIQPIIVRKKADNHYEIIAGERRWRAAQMAGLEKMPVIVRELTDEAALAVALIENIQRRDLNVIEEASALQRLVDEFQLTHQDIATAVGKSRTNVTNLLRLLRLNPEVRELVEQGQLEMGHARALLALENALQSEIAKQVVSNKLSVRETERLIQKLKQRDVTTLTKSKLDPNIISLQTNLADKLGAIVAIQHSNKGKGKLVIHYNSLDELEGILEHIE
ncbi:MAG: ParB/RepB/Spo0J family partition protein [Gammaproteobacteria bacterium]|nr:ParB/RepB/Spo0J family partition protein [Gammaproteobacteria bacterium]